MNIPELKKAMGILQDRLIGKRNKFNKGAEAIPNNNEVFTWASLKYEIDALEVVLSACQSVCDTSDKKDWERLTNANPL